MKSIRVINDLHLGSSYEIVGYYAAMEYARQSTPTVWNGDIVDMKNVKKAELAGWRARLHALKWQAIDSGHVWISGNHELDQADADVWAVRDGIFFTHGDLGFLWSEAKGRAYRRKEPGAGWFKRTFFSPLLEEMRDVWGAKIKQEFLDRVAQVGVDLPNVKMVICGHSHTRKVQQGFSQGVEYRVLPRGVNTVEYV
jgi:predicted phosphodiesterase